MARKPLELFLGAECREFKSGRLRKIGIFRRRDDADLVAARFQRPAHGDEGMDFPKSPERTDDDS